MQDNLTQRSRVTKGRSIVETVRSILDAIIQWLIMPATLIGGAGGLLSSIGKRQGWARTVFNAVSGAIVANVVFPVIEAYCPQPWHYTLFFLSGIGGLKMVESFYAWIVDDGILKDLLKRTLGKGGEK